MPKLSVTLDGTASIIDTDSLMLSELEVLEQHAGVDVEKLNDAKSLNSVRMIGNLLWIVRLRMLAAEKQIAIAEAAVLAPRAAFDVPVGTLDVRTIAAPKDRPAATTTTRTRPPASKTPRARSAKNTRSKSEDSPNS